MGKRFFSSWGSTLHFCWSNLMVTRNFSNLAAQFLLLGACGCAHSISCFQDDLSVLKALIVPIKKFFSFEWQVYLSNSFVPFQKQIKQPYPIELHLSCGRVPGSNPVFFLVRLSGCLATCHFERLLHKTISCSILHWFALVIPTLPILLEESRNYHVLYALILSCQIFCIYNNYSAVWLFHIIVIVYFSFYDNFCYTSKEKRYKVKL